MVSAMASRPQQPSSGDARQVITLPVSDGLISLRGLSPQRLRFELEYALERGSTANSFLFAAGPNTTGHQQAAVLVHPPGAAYDDVFLPALAAALPSDCKELLVVVGHVNPNRVALLRSLAEVYPQLTLICSNPGAKLLQELWQQRKPLPPGEVDNRPPLPALPSLQVIRQEQSLPLSHGHSLQLLPAPTPRWPGGLLAFEEQGGLLMSDKLFSAHVCTADWAESNRNATEEERRHFYDSLMAPMATQVDAVVERLEELDIRTIAPGHGPAIEASWRSLLSDYRRWGESQQKAALNVALLFASAYGNTAAIADALARGVSRTGVRVTSLNCEFTPADELVATIRSADAILIGSPTWAAMPQRRSCRRWGAGRGRSQQTGGGVRQLRLEWRGPRSTGEQAARWRLQLRFRTDPDQVQPRRRHCAHPGGDRHLLRPRPSAGAAQTATPQCRRLE